MKLYNIRKKSQTKANECIEFSAEKSTKKIRNVHKLLDIILPATMFALHFCFKILQKPKMHFQMEPQI